MRLGLGVLSLLLSVVPAAAVLADGVAAGDAEAKQGDRDRRARCALLLALGDELPDAERRWDLFETCVDAGRAPEGHGAAALAADLMRLNWSGYWRIAKVREAFGDERLRLLVSDERVTAPTSDGWTATDASRLATLLSHACIASLLEAHLRDNPEEPGYLRPQDAVAACAKARLPGGEPVPSLAELLVGRVLWMVFTRPPLRRVSIDTAGPSNLHFVIPRLDQAASGEPTVPRGYAVEVGEWTAHIAILPKDSIVTTTASVGPLDPFGPVHRVAVASDDLGFTLRRHGVDQLACLDIRAKLGAAEEYEILVDGHSVPRIAPSAASGHARTAFSRFFVEPGRQHRLQIVSIPPESALRDARRRAAARDGRERYLLVDQRIDRERLKPGGDCMPLHYDLALSKQVTMLLSVGAMCEQAGIDAEIVRLHVMNFVRRMYGEDRFVDLAQLRQVADAVKGARGATPAQTSEGQASRGERDFVNLLDALEQQHLYRGFDSVLDARLACSKRAVDERWDYSFAVTAHRPGRKQEVVGPYTLTTSDPTELADLIREPIARMHDDTRERGEPVARYARLVGVHTRQPSYLPARLVAEVHSDARGQDADVPVRLEVRKLGGRSARPLCEGVETYRQLRSTTLSSSSLSVGAVHGDAAAERDGSSEGEHAFVPLAASDDGAFELPDDGPGRYLLRVRHADQTQFPESSYRCVTVYEPTAYFWANGMIGHEALRLNEAIREGSGWRMSALVGYRMPGERLRFGLGGGYSVAWRKLRELPTLDDFATLSPEAADKVTASGQLPFSWRRHALMVFPSVEYQFDRWGRWSLWARGLLMGEVAILSGDVPKGLDTFKRGAAGADFDANVLVLAGSDFQLGKRYALSFFAGVGMYAFDDALFPDLREQNYDAALEFSLGLGFLR